MRKMRLAEQHQHHMGAQEQIAYGKPKNDCLVQEGAVESQDFTDAHGSAAYKSSSQDDLLQDSWSLESCRALSETLQPNTCQDTLHHRGILNTCWISSQAPTSTPFSSACFSSAPASSKLTPSSYASFSSAPRSSNATPSMSPSTPVAVVADGSHRAPNPESIPMPISAVAQQLSCDTQRRDGVLDEVGGESTHCMTFGRQKLQTEGYHRSPKVALHYHQHCLSIDRFLLITLTLIGRPQAILRCLLATALLTAQLQRIL
jgi:hypothetical protein